jgi:vitamin B12 transporter
MSRSPRLAVQLAAALLPFTPAQILAQGGTDSPTELDPVVVTATRTAEPARDTLASVSVIDRAEIERRQGLSVPDLLRGLPGVAVDGSGGPGQPASVFLRGTDADHVLVLIDGVKVGSATLGTFPFEQIPLAQIDRIEVVRGPRSSLYGSEAVGGVIQIFTRKGGGPLTPRASVKAGSYDTASATLGLSGGGEDSWFNLGGSFEETDGFDACRGRSDPYAGCGVEEPDADGFRNLGLSARGGWRLGEGVELDLHLLRTEGRTDFDGTAFSGNSARTEQQVGGARARITPIDPWTLTLAAGRSWDKYRAYYQGDFLDRFDTQRDTLTLQNDLTLAKGQLATLGLDYQSDRVGGTVDYTKAFRDNLALFGEYQGTLGPGSAKLSLRRDDYSELGSHTTGNAALGWLFPGQVQTSLSYGSAFKAPTFNDLYYPIFGNPDLSPEQSRSAELKVSGGHASGDWALSLYRTEIDDLIAFDSFTFQVANLDRAEIRGLEGSAHLRLWEIDLGLSLTLLDPQNRSEGPNDGKVLPRRPERMAQLDLDRSIGRWSVGATVYWSGRRYDDLANTVPLDPYTLVGLRAEYELSRAVRVQARLDNLLDDDYETAAFYNQAGRALYVTLRWEP